MNLFQITKSEIDTIFQTYQQRTQSEEIDFIQSEHEGIQGLAKKLNSDLKNGISSNEDSNRLRREYFDDNKRYREPMPSFWHYVAEAFEDEMLRILVVCAIFEITIGLSPLTENPGKDAFDGIGIVFAILVLFLLF